MKPYPLLLGWAACSGPSSNTTGRSDDQLTGGDPCEVPGNICTWLGVPADEWFMGREEGTQRTSVYLAGAADISFGTDGTAYYADTFRNLIRKVSPDGTVTTVSGTGMYGDGPPEIWESVEDADCWEGCPALESGWAYPSDVVVDPLDPDVLWVAAWQNSRVNQINQRHGTMTWWAGTGARFHADGPRQEAIFNRPTSLAFDSKGVLYISDPENHVIRRIGDDGIVKTIAGTPRTPGYDGDGGPALDAHLHGMGSRKADPVSRMTIAGNVLYVADYENGVVRTIDLDTCDGPDGPLDEDPSLDGEPTCVIEHFAGRYESAGASTFYDWHTQTEVTTDAGSVEGYAGDGGDADEAVFHHPSDVAVGRDGEVYVADRGNACVRVIHTDHTIEPFAGRCTEWGFEGDGGPATDALMSQPTGLAVDPDGNLYIEDGNVIRRVRVANEQH